VFFLLDRRPRRGVANQLRRAASITIAGNAQITKFLNESPLNSGPSANGSFTFNSSVPFLW
jgi:hypothetical protein